MAARPVAPAFLTRPAPGPAPKLPGGAWLGHLRAMRRDALGFLLAAGREHGPVVRLRFPGRPTLLVSDPLAIEHVLVGNQANYTKRTPGFDELRAVAGNGLFTADGDTWRRHRRVVQPAFQRERIGELIPAIERAAEDLAEQWEAKQGAIVDVGEAMSKLTLRITAEILLGYSLAANEGEVLARTITGAFQDLEARMTSFVKVPLGWPTPRNLRIRRAVRTLDRVIAETIARRRRTPGNDLLSRLIVARDAEGTLDEIELRDEVNTFYGAGYETTANALTWTWAMLSKHVAWCQRVEREADEASAARETHPQNPVLRAVVQEAMRLYPPAWVFSRRAIEQDVLGSHIVPEAAVLLLSPYVTHRLPSLWPNPDVFDPTRFLDANPMERPRFAYFPFGGGPRQCVGMQLALLEAEVVVATIARRVRLEEITDKLPVPVPALTLRPEAEFRMRIVRRIRSSAQ